MTTACNLIKELAHPWSDQPSFHCTSQRRNQCSFCLQTAFSLPFHDCPCKRFARFYESHELPEDCSHPQTRLVTNLRYSLEQLKVAGDRAGYLGLVERVVVGPAALRATDVEHLLGVNTDLFNRARGKRKAMVEGGLKPSWSEEGGGLKVDGRREGRGRSPSRTRGRSEGRPVRLQGSPERKGRQEGMGGQTPSWKSPDLHHQFHLFSRFGESGSDGSQITLTQTDKWLRQAKVIDGWKVTTTDTAIAFRKISRGSIWLTFHLFREFLEELIRRKGLNMQQVGEMLNTKLTLIQVVKGLSGCHQPRVESLIRRTPPLPQLCK